MKKSLDAAREYKFRLKVGLILAVAGFFLGAFAYLGYEFGFVNAVRTGGWAHALYGNMITAWHVAIVSDFAIEVGGLEWAQQKRLEMLISGLIMAIVFLVPFFAWVQSIKDENEVKS